MTTQPTPKPVREFTHNLVEAGGYFSVVISQMVEYSQRHPNPKSKSIPDTLRNLVEGILAAELKVHPADIVTASRVLSAAIDAISENLYFVNDSFMEEEVAGGEPTLN